MEWPKRVQGALSRVPGVTCAHVDFQTRIATVYCRSDCDREALVRAIRVPGYDGVIE